MRSILKTTAMAAGVLAAGLIGGTARAGSAIVDSTWQSSEDTSVNIKYTGTSGKGTYAGAFSITQHNPGHAGESGTKLFDAYCAALNVDVGMGKTTITANPILLLHGLDNSIGGYFKNSSHADVGNRLEFLLNKWDANNNANAVTKQALSLAIWNTIDKNFAINSITDPGNSVMTLYNTMLTFTGYTAGTVYNNNAVLLAIDPPNAYQNLIGIVPPGGPITPPGPEATPEPASVISALIGLGAAGMFARRRARRRAA